MIISVDWIVEFVLNVWGQLTVDIRRELIIIRLLVFNNWAVIFKNWRSIVINLSTNATKFWTNILEELSPCWWRNSKSKNRNWQVLLGKYCWLVLPKMSDNWTLLLNSTIETLQTSLVKRSQQSATDSSLLFPEKITMGSRNLLITSIRSKVMFTIRSKKYFMEKIGIK